MSQTIVKRIQLLLATILIGLPTVQAQDSWQSEQVDLQAGNGRRIKAIRYPKASKPKIEEESSTTTSTKTLGTLSLNKTTLERTAPVMTMEVNAPPVAGFVPWISVAVTGEREDDLYLDAVVEDSFTGDIPVGVDIENDYVVGLFDTGASAHVMGYEAATQLGIYSNGLLTNNGIVVSGVVGAVEALVSLPLGVFIDGLGAVDANTSQLNTSSLKGQSNVAIMVGDEPYYGAPDLPTAIGAPMSVYYTTHIRNDTPITLNRGDNEYTGPDIILYDSEDDSAPSYTNKIPLELRPLGATSVQYVPTVDLGLGDYDYGDWDDIFDGIGGSSEFPPSSPSILIGIGSQSLFFIHSVDLQEGDLQALDKHRFMLDTGAQVTVIGTRIAARLGLDAANAEFEVEIEGVTGQSLMAPGFTIDELTIPALGEWFRATDVPVVWLDISSPEGGTLDGIIGMNLFSDFNLILRGGGLMLEDDPALELQRIAVSN